MATIIQDTLDLIDGAVTGYAETVFVNFAGPIATTIQAAGLVSLALLAANTLMQWVPVRTSQYLTWGVRYVLVLSVATTWSQFLPIYEVLTNVPSSIGAELITATTAPTLNAALDELVTAIFDFADRASEESGWFTISLTSVVLIVLGALMAGIAILVSSVAKVGLAFAVALAPAFIATLLFKGTADLFRSWAKFTIGFALIPLVLAGVMGAVLYVAQEILTSTVNPSTLADAAELLVIVLVALIMMAQVPTMVNGLAGSIVATASGIHEARRTAALAGTAGGAGLEIARRRALATRSAAAAAGDAYRDGNLATAGRAIIDDFLRAKAAGAANREAFVRRQAALGRETSWAERSEAARAGADQYRRDALKGPPSGGSTSAPLADGPRSRRPD